MVNIDRLVKIYNNFGDRENLSPLLSADEMLSVPTLTDKQWNWINRFIVVWDYATNLDVQLHKKSAMAKKEKEWLEEPIISFEIVDGELSIVGNPFDKEEKEEKDNDKKLTKE